MYLKKKLNSVVLFAAITGAMVIGSMACKTVDVFEKNITIPKQEWDRTFQPEIVFVISDTTSLYNIYVTLRHTHAYNYNNIWLNVNFTLPGDTAKHQRVDIALADNNKGWLGTGMDDIYEVRKLITPQPYRFKNAGQCIFSLEQIMREDPLKHVMNTGIRVEKVIR